MSLLVCNLLIVITSLYRFLRTPPRVVEAGKSPIIPNLGSSGSEPSTSNDTPGTGESERAAEEEEGSNMSETGGRGGRSNDAGKTATPSSTTSGIELTELYESEFSFA